MSVDMAAGTATAAGTGPVPVIASGAEPIRVAEEFAASIAGGAIERDRAGAVPRRELAALDGTGLLGITVPGRYGGADLPAAVLAEVVRVIAATDPAIAQVPQSHFLFVDVLDVLGPPPLRQRLYAEVLAGARLANGMAERGGHHAQDLKTKLTRAGAGLRLTGRKFFEAARHDLSRHWRNARTHGSHDPVAWNYWVNNYLLNDSLLPNHGQI